MTDYQNQGWVRFYRKSLNSSVWKNANIWTVWSWCLLKANHQDYKFPFNNQDILVKKGQFITGREKSHTDIPFLSIQNIRTALTYLKSTNRITIKSTNKFSLITVIKWEEYQYNNQQINQQTNQPLTNNSPTTNQQLTTNKNDKNDKNVKNTSKEVEQAHPSFGREDINSVYSYLKEKIGGTPDGSQKQNRQFAKLLIDRLKKDYPDKDPVGLIELLIKGGLTDNFHAKNITSFKYLYYNSQKIIQAVKGQNLTAVKIR